MHNGCMGCPGACVMKLEEDLENIMEGTANSKFPVVCSFVQQFSALLSILWHSLRCAVMLHRGLGHG